MKLLVIGASGFVGKRLAQNLLEAGHEVRGLARSPTKIEDLAQSGCEVVPGDISDLASLERALESVEAVYISIHTLSPQSGAAAKQGFMEVEMQGLQNIVTACRTNGVRRLIYVTFLGAAPDAPSEWVRGRWKIEQFLLGTSLDVTVIRPGQIVGVGGHGFNMMMSQAKKSTALVMGNGRQKFRGIALDDLIYYLVGVLGNSSTYGKCYDVGCDDVLTSNQMIDVAAEVLKRKHPRKLHLSRRFLRLLAPLIERVGKLPQGAMTGLVDSLKTDSIGDPAPIRAILPQPPLPYRQAIERALDTQPREGQS